MFTSAFPNDCSVADTVSCLADAAKVSVGLVARKKNQRGCAHISEMHLKQFVVCISLFASHINGL